MLLTDPSPCVYSVSLKHALAVNHLTARLTDSTSLGQAEQVARDTVGFSEIDYEREKARRVGALDHRTVSARDLEAVHTYERSAAARGIQFVTFRRLAEATTAGAVSVTELRHRLIASRPEQLAWPLWSTEPVT